MQIFLPFSSSIVILRRPVRTTLKISRFKYFNDIRIIRTSQSNGS